MAISITADNVSLEFSIERKTKKGSLIFTKTGKNPDMINIVIDGYQAAQVLKYLYLGSRWTPWKNKEDDKEVEEYLCIVMPKLDNSDVTTKLKISNTNFCDTKLTAISENVKTNDKTEISIVFKYRATEPGHEVFITLLEKVISHELEQ